MYPTAGISWKIRGLKRIGKTLTLFLEIQMKYLQEKKLNSTTELCAACSGKGSLTQSNRTDSGALYESNYVCPMCKGTGERGDTLTKIRIDPEFDLFK